MNRPSSAAKTTAPMMAAPTSATPSTASARERAMGLRVRARSEDAPRFMAEHSNRTPAEPSAGLFVPARAAALGVGVRVDDFVLALDVAKALRGPAGPRSVGRPAATRSTPQPPGAELEHDEGDDGQADERGQHERAHDEGADEHDGEHEQRQDLDERVARPAERERSGVHGAILTKRQSRRR